MNSYQLRNNLRTISQEEGNLLGRNLKDYVTPREESILIHKDARRNHNKKAVGEQ